MSPEQELARYLQELRKDRGLTLRQVAEATGGVVSNGYLSQLEQGRRLEPGPSYLAALARAYGVPVRTMFEKAGYVERPRPSRVDVAYQQVLADSTFQFGTRFKGELDQDSKRVIIELYEKATNTKLLADDEEEGRKESSPRQPPHPR